ncbi:hypothetical protein I8G32_04677 [Rhodopseudomonas palustris]|uniref:Uncharacterized protein n=1 Tax=Rhodopseudomonas palustris (strain ATCC BAA-98 / CGA009) TaxID=258594 RepID=Q6N183_RHOPA|nr:hypothetical protein [Rhodopseudomonas palustris]OPF96106.1 hypothetical protein B1S06_04355 [Rhodopseudomonas palustris]QQM06099.1 hypothetical protein I8G32_04677 [Rhodopseudomonas palustris]RJF66691.1 hypothetical protein D4Q71_05240 [Rhodopseudomonas palustris]WAB77417.1 hypothetical protein OR798_23505 [Rhodopseudomonas palustris]WCL94728.1 hypothetical protein TX73_023500 [Rhodopseudomonas palustris CGA009]
MDVKVRGWHRDMGTHKIASHDLSDFRISDDAKKNIRWSAPGLFRQYGEVSVAWGQTLKFTGDYRMQIDFTQDDIFKLMKASYGRELDVDLLDKGFTVSEALKKKILSEIKLTDLTLGDLLGTASPQTAPQQQTGTVRPFRRRI